MNTGNERDTRDAIEALAELSRKTERRERILTSTLSYISDFAYIYDRDGRFLFVNQPLLDLWGIALEDAVGKNFFDLGYPHDLAEQLQREIQQVFDTETRLTGETPYTSPAGLDGYSFSHGVRARWTRRVCGRNHTRQQRRDDACAPPYRRHDGARVERRSGALPGRRYGRLCVEAIEPNALFDVVDRQLAIQ